MNSSTCFGVVFGVHTAHTAERQKGKQAIKEDILARPRAAEVVERLKAAVYYAERIGYKKTVIFRRQDMARFFAIFSIFQ